METVMKTSQSHWFVLDSCPEVVYPATRFGAQWNGWATPSVTASTLAALLLRVISDPDGPYRAFAIDPLGRCSLLDSEGRVDIMTPDEDGLYDIAGLGWTLRDVSEL